MLKRKSSSFLSIALALFLTILLLSSCGSPEASASSQASEQAPEEISADVEAAITTLENASTITVKKAVVSIGDSWEVLVDDVKIATIKGEFIYVLGDTYTMRTIAGNIMGSEGEQYRIINHNAILYDKDGNQNGSIKEEFFSFWYKFYINDADEQLVGTAEQNLSLTLSADIKDADDNVAWRIDKKFFAIGSTLTIEKKAEETDVSAMQAVWMTVIMSEIDEAANEDDDDDDDDD